MVETSEGPKPIEDIRVGDLVQARDERTVRTVPKPVVKLFRRHNQRIFDVTLSTPEGFTEVVGATAEHPFHVHGLGWVGASKLAPGEIVDRLEGEGGRVVSVEREKEQQDTYNFEVAGVHSYFVGQSHAWVHNQCTDLPDGYKWSKDPKTGDTVIEGPKGGIYEATGRYDVYGNPVYKNNGKYYTFTPDAATQVPFDTGVFKFNSVQNPGPLAALRDRPALNFFGGNYNMTILADDLTLYRAGSNIPRIVNGVEVLPSPWGRWFTRTPPDSVAQVRIDSAVKAQWVDPITGGSQGSSPIDTVFPFTFPKGTVIYEGPVATQGGVYLGGQNKMQIFIENPRTIPGVTMGKPWPLR